MPEPQGRGSAIWPWLLLAAGLAIGALGAFFAVKWLTTDAPDVYGSCSRGSGACLTGGETLNMVMTLVWGPLGLIGTACGAVLVVRHRRRAAADRALLATGRHGLAIITGVRQRGSVTRTNGRITSQGYLLTLDPGDGGAPLRLKVTFPPGVTAGSRVRVAYDPTTRDAVLLDDPTAPATRDRLAPI
ncbi:MAG TPA: hypothetical protein VF533_18690 [Solirubrobacteraceae bacterium]|jgi:hypothetical protein